MKKRITAVLLSVMMVVTLLPAVPVASAQTSEKEAAVKGFAEVDAILAGHNDTDIYKTNDYVHLPYYQEDAVKDVTIYFEENSADNIASGTRSFSLHEWLRFAPVVGQLMRNVAEPRYHDVSHSLTKDGLIWRYQGNDKVAYADDPYATILQVLRQWSVRSWI